MRQDVYGIKNLCNYKTDMFLYNDDENAWISKIVISKTTISPLIYLYRTNLF